MNLKSLHNSPNIVKDFFSFANTSVDSYKEGPKEIGGNLYCDGVIRMKYGKEIGIIN